MQLKTYEQKTIIIILLAVGLPIAWWLISPLWNNVVLDEQLPTVKNNLESTFAKAPMVARAHDVKGEALLVKAGDQDVLRFENLETINGPDLRIYLSADLSAGDIVDLGPIRATRGNVNYVIPAGTDLSKYKNALIWCRAFGVLFSYAQL